jgi:hypothetical protein
VFIAIVITDILLLAITYLLFNYLRTIENSLSNTFGKITLLHGHAMKLEHQLADLQKFLLITFDNELVKKMTAVLQIGEKPENMMKKFNPKTGEDELVSIDHGW